LDQNTAAFPNKVTLLGNGAVTLLNYAARLDSPLADYPNNVAMLSNEAGKLPTRQNQSQPVRTLLTYFGEGPVNCNFEFKVFS
jgi:hypothetical protein